MKTTRIAYLRNLLRQIEEKSKNATGAKFADLHLEGLSILSEIHYLERK